MGNADATRLTLQNLIHNNAETHALQTSNGLPSFSADLFADEALRDPLPLFREVQALGPFVWLEAQQVLATARLAECRQILRTPDKFISGEGVGLNDTSNGLTLGSVLASDGALHTTLKNVLSKRFSPGAMKELKAAVQKRADELVDSLVGKGAFDAVRDLTQAFPLSVVCDFIGFPHEDRHQLLPWATAVFDFFGPPNARCLAAEPATRDAFAYAFNPELPARILPGSAGAEIFAAVARGDLTPPQGCILVMAYVSAALDTTIASLQHLLHLFATHPEQWQKLRASPELIPAAYNEVLRLGAPIRGFARVAAQDCEVSGVSLKQGARILLLYAAANRDPEAWKDPDRFDITRDASAHLSFGHGVHLCAGAPLARLEAHCMMEALARKVQRIHVHAATPLPNNLVQSLGELRISLTA